MKGYNGILLEIDLTSETITKTPIPEENLLNYIVIPGKRSPKVKWIIGKTI